MLKDKPLVMNIYMCDNGYPEGEYIVGKYFKTKGRSIIFKKKGSYRRVLGKKSVR